MQRIKKLDIEKTIELLKAQNDKDSNSSWRTLRNRLDSILSSGNSMSRNNAMGLCHLLNNMNYTDRKQHILSNWGPQYANKCEALLKQLESLELRMSREK